MLTMGLITAQVAVIHGSSFVSCLNGYRIQSSPFCKPSLLSGPLDREAVQLQPPCACIHKVEVVPITVSAHNLGALLRGLGAIVRLAILAALLYKVAMHAQLQCVLMR
jgi:hypothetical protein